MRKWQNRSAPNDPESWFDVDGMWPTKRGTYETAHFLTGTDYVASSAGAVAYSFCAATLSSRREYVVDATHIWEWTGAAFSDRTNSVTVGGNPMMAQFGDVTLCAMGASAATVKSTGGNFSVQTSAPQGEIICVQSNAVLIFNTNTSADGWAASDVADYTNWTTGEAASGRLIATPGPITAAIPFGNDVLVFKSDAIYRMRYVGGSVKWTSEVIHTGLGCAYLGLQTNVRAKYNLAAGTNVVLFSGYYDWATSAPTSYIYAFDGASPPVRVNPLTTVLEGPICYNPQTDVFAITARDFSPQTIYFYCATTGAWGKWATGLTQLSSPLLGTLTAHEASGSTHQKSNTPVQYEKVNANNIKRWQHATAPPGDTVGSCYLQTAKLGQPNGKTTFDRVIPLLRRRRDLGTDSATMSMELFRELEDTSAQTTQGSIAESTFRKRFDLKASSATDNFARFKVTWAALDVEVDDFLVKSHPTENTD